MGSAQVTMNMASENAQHADLEIWVIRAGGPSDDRHYEFVVRVPKSVSRMDVDDCGPFEKLGILEYQDELKTMTDHALRVVNDLTGKLPRAPRDDRFLANRLKNIGAELWSTLLPCELQDLLKASIYSKDVNDVPLVQVFTDECCIPWDLLRPRGEEFLCSRCALGRWFLRPSPNKNRRQAFSVAPPTRVSLNEGIAVGAQLNGGAGGNDIYDSLYVKDEISGVCNLLNSCEMNITEEPALRSVVLESLSRHDHTLYHLVAHGAHDENCDPTYGAMIILNDGEITPIDIPLPEGGVVGSRRPFVFFNACHAGSSTWQHAGLRGWAARWVEAECQAFVAPMFSVEDRLHRDLRLDSTTHCLRELRWDSQSLKPGSLSEVGTTSILRGCHIVCSAMYPRRCGEVPVGVSR